MNIFELQAERKLVNLAKSAKSRMKSGFWGEHQERMKQFSDKVIPAPIGQEVFNKYLKASKIKSRPRTLDEIEDERVYPKVCQIIEEDGGLNPIGQLIDRSRYEKMTVSQKESYILELSNRYKRLKERYFLEEELKKSLRI